MKTNQDLIYDLIDEYFDLLLANSNTFFYRSQLKDYLSSKILNNGYDFPQNLEQLVSNIITKRIQNESIISTIGKDGEYFAFKYKFNGLSLSEVEEILQNLKDINYETTNHVMKILGNKKSLTRDDLMLELKSEALFSTIAEYSTLNVDNIEIREKNKLDLEIIERDNI
jgi:hypothetical protein